MHLGQTRPQLIGQACPQPLAGWIKFVACPTVVFLRDLHTLSIDYPPRTGCPRPSDILVGLWKNACPCLSYTDQCTSSCCSAYRISCALELMPIFSRMRVR